MCPKLNSLSWTEEGGRVWSLWRRRRLFASLCHGNGPAMCGKVCPQPGDDVTVTTVMCPSLSPLSPRIIEILSSPHQVAAYCRQITGSSPLCHAIQPRPPHQSILINMQWKVIPLLFSCKWFCSGKVITRIDVSAAWLAWSVWSSLSFDVLLPCCVGGEGGGRKWWLTNVQDNNKQQQP